MADIDMIPRAYREAVRAERSVRGYGTALALLLVAGCAACALLHWRVGRNEIQLAQLRIDSARAAVGGAQLDAARSSHAMLTQAAASLATLRGANDAVRIADAIDAAIADGVWFDQISFTRDAQLLSQPGTGQAGELVLPALPGGAGAGETWQLVRRLEITGSAADYKGLTSMLGRLSAQKPLVQVRLVRSGAAAAAATGGEAQQPAGVDFSIAATVGGMP